MAQYTDEIRKMANMLDAQLADFRDFSEAVRGAEMRMRKLLQNLPNSTSAKLLTELQNIHDILSFKN